MSKSIIKKGILVFFSVIVGLSLLGCDRHTQARGAFIPSHSNSLMQNLSASSIDTVALDNTFINAKINLSFDLFYQMIETNKNTMISGTSILLALSLLANGADGNTLDQIEQVIGMPIASLNRFLYSFIDGLHSCEKSQLEIANAVWFRRNGINVSQDFLERALDYFNATAYASNFNQDTINDINNWVAHYTDGMIPHIINDLDPLSVMALFNAIMFDAEWAVGYEAEDILQNRIFVNQGGQEQRVTMMQSIEQGFLIDGDYATGFRKNYYGRHYSFVALLPNEGICVIEYAKGMSGTRFLSILNNGQHYMTKAHLPKFEFSNNFGIIGALKNLGINDLFCEQEANLTRIGTPVSGNLFVNEGIHSTFIEVNEKGTRAAAATGFFIGCSDGRGGWYQREVILNRPFMFAIIDNNTNLPIFKGTVLNI